MYQVKGTEYTGMKGAMNIVRQALTHTTAAAAEAEEDNSLPGERVLEVSVKHCTTSNACMAVISTPVISCCSVRRASRMAVIRSGPSYSAFCACVCLFLVHGYVQVRQWSLRNTQTWAVFTELV